LKSRPDTWLLSVAPPPCGVGAVLQLLKLVGLSSRPRPRPTLRARSRSSTLAAPAATALLPLAAGCGLSAVACVAVGRHCAASCANVKGDCGLVSSLLLLLRAGPSAVSGGRGRPGSPPASPTTCTVEPSDNFRLRANFSASSAPGRRETKEALGARCGGGDRSGDNDSGCSACCGACFGRTSGDDCRRNSSSCGGAALEPRLVVSSTLVASSIDSKSRLTSSLAA